MSFVNEMKKIKAAELNIKNKKRGRGRPNSDLVNDFYEMFHVKQKLTRSELVQVAGPEVQPWSVDNAIKYLKLKGVIRSGGDVGEWLSNL